VAIRRFSKERLTIDKLVEFGSLNDEAAEFLRAAVVGKRNVIVSGGTGSGKTSLLGALSSFIPDGDRTVVLEDARELQLQKDHVVHLEA
jgi:pilus assembly protein CpaF